MLTAERPRHERRGRHEAPRRIPERLLWTVVRLGIVATIAATSTAVITATDNPVQTLIVGAYRYDVEHRNLIPPDEVCVNPPTAMQQVEGLGMGVPPREAEALFYCADPPDVVVL
ncbi:MAG TPA: hypothetical protein VGS28_05140 [Candidatus Saccharimonadales bacterium]|nr:hypothetical protein [Candidatus Saccharimonadales bacterium]